MYAWEIQEVSIKWNLNTYFILLLLDLEKKIQDLNLSRQEKVDQMKQLEDQVITTKMRFLGPER